MCTLARLAAFYLVTLFVPGVADAATTGSVCTDLAAVLIEDANLLSASVVPAARDLPEHCRQRLPADFDGIIAGAPALDYTGPPFARGFLRYMVFAEDPGETYRLQDFDFERNSPRLAPDSIPSARVVVDGAAAWSRPACPYPESAGCGP
jgi:hypothetical protein